MNALEAYQLVLPHLPATRSQLAKNADSNTKRLSTL